MPEPRTLARVAAAVAAVLAVTGTGHAVRNARRLRRVRAGGPAVLERVALLVPARDEQHTIGACVTGALAQEEIPELTVAVLDDNSGDGTADLARRAAGPDPRFRMIRSTTEPPSDWLGKPWACQRLAEQARADVLVFVDADVRLRPGAVAAAVRTMRTGDLDLLSAWPHQESRTPLARLVQPLQQWSWLTTLPLALMESSPREQLAAANGQFLVVDAGAYRATGGHAAVRGDVLDDIALARAVKRAGGRISVADASTVAACLMYASDAALVDGYAKSLWRAFGRPAGALVVSAALIAVYAGPAVAAVVARDPWVRAIGAAGYLAGVAGRIVTARATNGPIGPEPWLHPLSVVSFGGLAVVSVVRHHRGTTNWRGRPVTPVAPRPPVAT